MEGIKLELVIFAFVAAFFGLAASFWGADSNDGPNSLEWERRHKWRGFRR